MEADAEMGAKKRKVKPKKAAKKAKPAAAAAAAAAPAGAAAAAGGAKKGKGGGAKKAGGYKAEGAGFDEELPAGKTVGFPSGERPTQMALLVRMLEAALCSVNLEVALIDKQWLTVGDFTGSLGSERGPATLEGIIGALKELIARWLGTWRHDWRQAWHRRHGADSVAPGATEADWRHAKTLVITVLFGRSQNPPLCSPHDVAPGAMALPLQCWYRNMQPRRYKQHSCGNGVFEQP